MPDEFDQAAVLETREREASIARARHASREAGSIHCTGCGDEIPVARRVANPHALRCLDCQSSLEARQDTRRPR